ncbi:unnamed protein product [Acanthoscelides obtectus]|uniref:Mos1 transposase HTH domain-containing protein n=1 Tax=Acanthoscelides obtectus TaxID=200917 RepID=A0A9P0PSB0_ACAOB|nr:unnamed protein product [Acanthoscelides obtectus]CAK1660038.1 Histone-lysine N-methyltransferase SETMAR [Acanthoscelides obtectus]
MELNREHFRAIIYYNFQRQLSQQECLAELLSVFGNQAPHQSTISRWYGEFKRGRVSSSDDPRVGAPKTAVNQENVDAVRKPIIEDRHVTYREIEASLKISNTSIQKIVHDELGVRKSVSRWIPHLLTEQQKAARLIGVKKRLAVSIPETQKMYSIVSGDESWIYCYEPENKRQSGVWVVSKNMVATFVSKAGHIATIPLNQQRTVTADWYTTICLPKVITELRKINPARRITVHQDNAISRWIPHLLTEQQKAASIVSGDESWIYCYEPENKRHVSKNMVATFVSKAGHIATIPLNQQRTVTADWYTTICLPKVITELRKINPARRITVHQDNASSHTAQKTRQYLTEENVELLDNPPYNPDLSPTDFFTSPKIKNRLRGQRFQSPEEAVDAFKNAILDLPANEWNKCFENFLERMQMCINLRGEYFEKQ